MSRTSARFITLITRLNQLNYLARSRRSASIRVRFRSAIRGGYGKGTRKSDRLAKRFASLELTVLPDRAFQGADAEVAFVIAKDPIPHDVCRVTYRRVDDNAEAWTRFEREHEVSVDYSANFGTESAREGFTIPALQDVWGFLVNHPRLGSVADVHRGLEWKTGRPTVLNKEAPDYRLGVAPQTDFKVFEVPRMSYSFSSRKINGAIHGGTTGVNQRPSLASSLDRAEIGGWQRSRIGEA